MRVLVTGGTGVIGEGLIPALLRDGHEVRLLTRGADDAARRWSSGVEPFAADVSDAPSLEGACDGCGAVVHVTGIVKESPPKVTFERVNVGGTKNVLKEAARAGVRRLVYVSSLGADRGASAYHRSKRRAEEFVRKFRGAWLILRPGSVYGPGDEVVSTLLKMMRALPALPLVGDGEQRFQPVWHEDLGAAIARAVVDDDLTGETFELAGEEITTTRDVIARLGRITGRTPALVPVPSLLASLGVRAAAIVSADSLLEDALGIDAPIDDAKVTMLLEENFIREPGTNALTNVFGVKPLPLDKGLRLLADSIPEQLPSRGFGPLKRKLFWADIRNSRHAPPRLIEIFRERCAEIMPIEFGAEPGTLRKVARDATLTASLPLRGNIQMRVAESDDRRVTFVTIEGHPLAGVVSFSAEPQGGKVRFAVEIHARAANALDFVTMSTVGSVLQDANWEQVVRRVVELSGGAAPGGVEREDVMLDEDAAGRVERWVEELVVGRKRAKNGGAAKASVDKKLAGSNASRKVGRKAVGGKASAKRAASKKSSKSAARKAVTKAATKTRARAAAKALITKTGARRSPGAGRDAGDTVADAVSIIASAALSAVDAISSVASDAAQPSAGKRRQKK